MEQLPNVFLFLSGSALSYRKMCSREYRSLKFPCELITELIMILKVFENLLKRNILKM